MAQTGTRPVEKDPQVADLSSNDLELRYAANSDLAHRKKLGQFFTPYSVACFMSQWIAQVSARNPKILDPCAGLGVFERALWSTDPMFAAQASFMLWEKDERLAAGLSGVCERMEIKNSIVSKDFINEHDWSARYDGIIANPPYYKHHYVENKEDVRKVISSNTGTSFSVQTNIYGWFLIKALALLKPGGRLAFIIPTEFLNANYGREIKKYLLESGNLRHIISISYKSKTFDDAMTTACVLLAEKGAEPARDIRFYHADSHDQLGKLADFLDQAEFIDYGPSSLDIDRKWRSYFPGTQAASKEASNVVPFSTYGRFSRGIATGANTFFAISPSTAQEHGLPQRSLTPCLSKARHAQAKTFTSRDFEALLGADKPVYLFDGQATSDVNVDRYIRLGEESGFQHRYLTRMRKPWYALEKRLPSQIWVGVFSRTGVRFIWNESKCISLTCFHVFQPSELGSKYLPLLFLYLNSAAGNSFLELEKREYGDGLAKYEPNDINKAMAPDFTLLSENKLKRLVELQRLFLDTEKGSSDEASILDDANQIFDALIQHDTER